MNPGRMNRRLTIQARTLSKDSAGGKVETWADSFDCWGELMASKGSEAIAANADRPKKELKFRIRYKSGLNAASNRVLYQLAFYDIEEIIEEGIRDKMIVRCSSLQSLTN